MSGDVMLTDAERETLWEAIERAFLDTTMYSREDEAAIDRAVEGIVAARMAEALREAADDVEDECRFSTGQCYCGSADWLRARADKAAR